MSLSPEALVEATEVLFATRCAVVAACTALLYEYFTTLASEVELFWTKKWSVLKILYLWHRYFGIVCIMTALRAFLDPHVSFTFCSNFWFNWEFIGYSFVVLGSEMTVLIWIYVLYNRSLKVLGALSAVFLLQAMAIYSIVGIALSSVKGTVLSVPGARYCGLSAHPKVMLQYYWTPVLAYNVVVFALLLYKAYHMFAGSANNRAMFKIYKDCLVNVFGTLTAYLWCCIVWLSANFALAHIPVMIALVLTTTSSTRLLLNIRSAYYDGDRENSLYSSSYHDIVVESESPRDEWMFELRQLRWKGDV